MSQLAGAMQAAKYDLDAFFVFPDGHPYGRGDLIDDQRIWMAGEALDYHTIPLNIVTLLYPLARAKGFRVQTSDVLVRNPEQFDFAARPGVLVHCDPRQGQDCLLPGPTVMVDVLSRPTILFDRRGKFALYRSMASVQQIVFVDQDEVCVENWLRANDTQGQASDLWTVESLGHFCQKMPFTGLDAGLAVSHTYESAMPPIATA